MISALKHRDYRLLWVGQAVSLFGDQFHLVALPWLVMTLSPDPLHIGLAFAAASIPRAAFMLLGGAFADRHSPRLIMLVSDSVRFAVSAALAAAILTGEVRLWMVFALAAVFGTVSGFFHPAANASIPRLVDDGDLESGNSLFQIADQAAAFAGPALAGLLIALFGRSLIAGEEIASSLGIGTAFAVDALSFAFSAACLLLMRPLGAPDTASEDHPLKAIRDGLAWVWNEAEIRWMLIIITLANALVSGPLLVGLPVLANQRFGNGPVAFGVIMSAFAGGNLLGMVGAGSLPRPSGRAFVAAAVSLIGGFGVAIATLAFVSAAWQALPLMALVGAANGYMAVTFITQLQRVTPTHMLGRIMGLFMLSMYGLMPLSQAGAGFVLRSSVAGLFVGAGSLLVAVALLALSRPELRALSTRLDMATAEH